MNRIQCVSCDKYFTPRLQVVGNSKVITSQECDDCRAEEK